MRGLSNENRQHCNRESLATNLCQRVMACSLGLHLPQRVRFALRALSQKAAAYLNDQRGFSLIEVLVAVGILGFIGVAVIAALDTNSRAARTLDEQVVAANLATAYLEVIKEFPYAATYPNAGDNITIPFQYSVVINTECSSDGTTWASCSGSETLQKITVIVSREGKGVLSLCTYRTKR